MTTYRFERREGGLRAAFHFSTHYLNGRQASVSICRSTSRGIDFHEYSSAKSGRELDKTLIRRGLKEAVREVGRDPELTLKDALAERGIVMEKASRGEFKYRLEGRRLEFKGSTLGERYGKDAIQKEIAMTRELSRAVDNCISL